ncbi:MAG: hypothetical protein QF632_00990 [Candidatus Woesearchaeota archaeon]|jgi:translin|nr:hypothetical protein [Candidatus Woesearchaeota archaeon]MDP7323317.1 hypothetical protein [Candidatus Woesearchaeota archaeon]MDP7458501.1 hypothetical protein [Candidatus Woesearchaeota archaeon]
MLNKQEFVSIRKDLDSFEKSREGVIQLSRSIIQLSKQIIYAVHRDDMTSAESNIPKIKAMIKKIPTKKFDTGIDRVALQEYVEALTYYHYIKSNTILTRKDLNVDTESYLLGLCDLTGELVRRGVNQVIKKKFSKARKTKEIVEAIYGEFLKFDLRNGELRKKSDQIKYNLLRIENVMYDIRNEK